MLCADSRSDLSDPDFANVHPRAAELREQFVVLESHARRAAAVLLDNAEEVVNYVILRIARADTNLHVADTAGLDVDLELGVVSTILGYHTNTDTLGVLDVNGHTLDLIDPELGGFTLEDEGHREVRIFLRIVAWEGMLGSKNSTSLTRATFSPVHVQIRSLRARRPQLCCPEPNFPL